MFKRITITLILLAGIVLTISPVSAAVDWNLDMLGFSSNSQFFILAESVVEDGSGIPRAKIIIADVATNQCVQGGCLESTSSPNGDTEQDALQQIYQKTWTLRKELGLTPPQSGYLANGPFFGEDDNTAHYSYNDQKIYVTLLQKTVPGEDDFNQKAAIQMTMSTSNETGQHVKKVLDSLNNYRENAQKYQLGRLYVSPDRKSVAILVHVFYRGFEGYDIRTIVQSAQLF